MLYDKEARGFLPLDEFKKILREIDPELPEDELDEMIDEIDGWDKFLIQIHWFSFLTPNFFSFLFTADGSGTIDFDGKWGCFLYITVRKFPGRHRIATWCLSKIKIKTPLSFANDITPMAYTDNIFEEIFFLIMLTVSYWLLILTEHEEKLRKFFKENIKKISNRRGSRPH